MIAHVRHEAIFKTLNQNLNSKLHFNLGRGQYRACTACQKTLELFLKCLNFRPPAEGGLGEQPPTLV